MGIANPVFFLEVSSDWYRQRPVKAAFALSLLVHAAAIALLPGLRVPRLEQPAPLIVELVALPQPESSVPVAQPEPRPEAARVVKKPALLPQSRPEFPPVPAPIRTQPEPIAAAEVEREPIPEPLPRPPEARPEASPPTPVPQTRPAPQPAPAEPQLAAKLDTPAPSIREPRPSLDVAALKAYGEMLAQAIGKRKDYPRLARMRNWQGTTELKLQIGSDGKLHDVVVGHSSGFEMLDAAAIRMVQESVPLPDVPETLRGRELTMTVPVVFKLQSL